MLRTGCPDVDIVTLARVVEQDLDTRLESLVLKHLVDRVGLRSAADQVEERLGRADRVAVAEIVQQHKLPGCMEIEIPVDPPLGKEVDKIFFSCPVFNRVPIGIAVRASFGIFFENRNAVAFLRQADRGGQTRQASAGNLDRI